MRKIVFGLGFFVSFLVSTSSIHASPDWLASEGEIVVQFKREQAPTILQEKAEKRSTEGKPFTHKIKVWFEDMTNAIKNVESPENHLKAIDEVGKQLGVQKVERIFSEDNVENIYLIRYVNDIAPLEASDLYKRLSEVEFAEPNYILEELGI